MFQDVEENTLIAEDLVLLEMSRMERNCWAVLNEVSLCIYESPRPHCIMKGFVPQEKANNSFMITFGVQSKLKKSLLFNA